METVLVTGASGYIGRHVVDELAQHDCEVVVCDSQATDDPRYRVARVDLFDADNPTLYADLGSPDRCIHLAWTQGFVHNSPEHLEQLPKHVAFVRMLLDHHIRSISLMGTMHEVGYHEGAVDEATPCEPLSLYGIAKNSLRQASLLMAAGGPTSVKWLRGYYVTGDDQLNHSVFAKLSQAAQAGQASFPFTSGKNAYDFLDVHELARQIVAASLQDEVEGIINCCSGVPVSLGERAERFIAEHAYNIRLDYGAFPDRPYDSPAIWGDPSKIERIMARARGDESVRGIR